MRKLAGSVLASVLAVATLAVPLVNAGWPGSGAQAGRPAAAVGDPDEHDGPPPWAHSADRDKHATPGLGSWKELTPDQRDELMKRLTREHRAGMKAYRACRSEGRAGCEKPLPPGLAKRQ